MKISTIIVYVFIEHGSTMIGLFKTHFFFILCVCKKINIKPLNMQQKLQQTNTVRVKPNNSKLQTKHSIPIKDLKTEQKLIKHSKQLYNTHIKTWTLENLILGC